MSLTLLESFYAHPSVGIALWVLVVLVSKQTTVTVSHALGLIANLTYFRKQKKSITICDSQDRHHLESGHSLISPRMTKPLPRTIQDDSKMIPKNNIFCGKQQRSLMHMIN